jgi:hypothetical protein
MLLRAWRFVTLLLTALALTMTSAHVLELAPKMRYDAELYTAVNATLYRYFATVGAVYTLGSVAAAGVLAYLVRGRRSAFGWTLAGGICLLLAFGSWIVLVAPVNRDIAAALSSAPGSVPEMWMRLRPRWEYGHVTGFAIQLAGFCLLLASVLVETPGPEARRPAGRPIELPGEEWREASRQGGLLP